MSKFLSRRIAHQRGTRRLCQDTASELRAVPIFTSQLALILLVHARRRPCSRCLRHQTHVKLNGEMVSDDRIEIRWRT
jgi:hypothetical protein